MTGSRVMSRQAGRSRPRLRRSGLGSGPSWARTKGRPRARAGGDRAGQPGGLRAERQGTGHGGSLYEAGRHAPAPRPELLHRGAVLRFLRREDCLQ